MTAGTVSEFGTTPDGETVVVAEIGTGEMTARIMSWGASLQDLRLAPFDHSLVLGSPVLEPYLTCMKYFGAVVGPVANRIEGGQFSLGGETFDLEKNERGKTMLHGGFTGIGQSNWTLKDLSEQSCTYTIRQANGHNGYPGNIEVEATYHICADNTLTLNIRATSDRDTYFSPAFHGLWTLDGRPQIDAHRLHIPAETYLPIDDDLIPLGKPADVAGTSFDYLKPAAPADDLDHNYCFTKLPGAPGLMCTLEVPDLRLSIHSTEPGLQVYSGGTLNTAPFEGHQGHVYGAYSGIALEPQYWPNHPNVPEFASSLLRPGAVYHQRTTFGFDLLR